MSLNISTDFAYIVSMSDAEGAGRVKEFDSIAQGLVIKEDPSHPEGAWGTAAWFDKAAAYMRMIMIQNPPIIEGATYRILDQNKIQYSFQFITKNLFDTEIKRMLPEAPEVSSDQEAQKYISGLNPYQ